MQLLFVDECEKYKQLIHVHSFAHDVHLRCVTDYLRGDDSVLPADFDVPGFLSRFLDLCSVPPSFARNCVAHGEQLSGVVVLICLFSWWRAFHAVDVTVSNVLELV